MKKPSIKKEQNNLERIAALADEGLLALPRQLSNLEDYFLEEIGNIAIEFEKYATIEDLKNLSDLVKSNFKPIKDSLAILKNYDDTDINQKVEGIKEVITSNIISLNESIQALNDSLSHKYIQDFKRVFDEISAIRSQISLKPLPVNTSNLENKVSRIELLIQSLPTTKNIEERLATYTPQVVEDLLQNILELEKKIKFLEKENDRYKTWPTGGGSSGIKQIVAGTGVTVDNSNPGYPVVTASGGVTILTTASSINNNNTNFVFSEKPTLIVVGNNIYRETTGWTWNIGTLTATLLNGPVGTGGDIYGLK